MTSHYRSPRFNAARRGLLAVLFAAAVSACNTTVVETDRAAGTDPALSVESSLPATTNEQLREMVDITRGLGQLIADGDDADAVARLELLWGAASPIVGDVEPALGREVEHQLGIIRLGVERNRPADTDKAYRNLDVVVTSYIAKHP